MSPTEAMLIRKERLLGSGGGAGLGAGVATASTGVATSTGAGVSVGAVVAQPASVASSRSNRRRGGLVTEPDSKHVDLCCSQTAAQDVEFVEVTGWSDAYAVIGLFVDHYPLNL